MKRPFSILVKEYATNLDIRDNSRAVYIRVLNQFAKWVVIVGLDIKTLTRADMLRYKAHLMREDKSENTIDLYLTVLRSFYEYLELRGEHENIAAGIRLKHKRFGFRKKHLSVDQVKALYNSIDRSTLRGVRDYALINLMIRSGIRTIEASRLRVCDIDVVGDIVRLSVWRKGDNDRSEQIGVSIKAIQPLFDYLNFKGVSSETEYVFSSANKAANPLTPRALGEIICGRLRDSGLHSKMITAHSLRHTTAVQALQAGVSLKDIQLLLGHRSVKTTEVYLKSIEDERRINNPATKSLDELF